MDHQKEYEKYTIAKTNVQLNEAILEKVNIDKFKDMSGDGYFNEIHFGKRHEIIGEDEIHSYFRTEIKCIEEKTRVQVLYIEIIYKGIFKSNTYISENQLERWADIQTIPQLLPYVRSIVASLTSHMSIIPIFLPTMDILESLKINDSDQSVGE